jgi:hypothetical protein
VTEQNQDAKESACGQSVSTGMLGAWVPISERLPPDETPVLLFRKGKKVIGELRWERPNYEDSFHPRCYWSCCEDRWNDDLEEAAVTHWALLIEDPNV